VLGWLDDTRAALACLIGSQAAIPRRDAYNQRKRFRTEAAWPLQPLVIRLCIWLASTTIALEPGRQGRDPQKAASSDSGLGGKRGASATGPAGVAEVDLPAPFTNLPRFMKV